MVIHDCTKSNTERVLVSLKRTTDDTDITDREDFAAQLLMNHLVIRVIRVIRGLIIFRRKRCLLERWHFELDLGELIGGLAELAQEGQPARVAVDLVEQVLRYDIGESRVLVCYRLVEPIERFVRIAAECVDVRDVIRKSPSRTSRSTCPSAASASALRPSAQ
jgi:hypothetical protein